MLVLHITMVVLVGTMLVMVRQVGFTNVSPPVCLSTYLSLYLYSYINIYIT